MNKSLFEARIGQGQNDLIENTKNKKFDSEHKATWSLTHGINVKQAIKLEVKVATDHGEYAWADTGINVKRAIKFPGRNCNGMDCHRLGCYRGWVNLSKSETLILSTM